MKDNRHFYIIIFGLFLGICAPNLWSDGMFMDGLFYATISRNLAEGLGSFWQLYFTATSYPIFYEHPPLAMGLQSICFQLFGDSIYVERFYSFFTFIATGLVIHLIWVKISRQELKHLSWIPLFLWIIIPLNSWACANNMLENTMNIFVSLSVLFALHSLKSRMVVNTFFAGICLSLAFLSKGFVGLFPLSIFFWHFIVFKEINLKETLIRSTQLLLFTIIPFIFLYFIYPLSIDSISHYIHKQVIGSIQNISTVDSRFYIFKKLIMEFLPVLLLCLIAFIVSKKKKWRRSEKEKKWVLFFLLLGLSGVFPIMISMKQSGFYILTTFPLFCIACGVFLAPLFTTFDIHKYKLHLLSTLILAASIFLSVKQKGVIGRNKEMIEDIYMILTEIPKNSIISIDNNMRKDYSLIGYFARYGNVSLKNNSKLRYHISYSGDIYNSLDYELVEIDTEMIFLYKKK